MSSHPNRGRGRGFSGVGSRERNINVRFSRPDTRNQRRPWNSEDNHEDFNGRYHNEQRQNGYRQTDRVGNNFAKPAHEREYQQKEPRGMTYGRLKEWAGAEDADDLALFMSNEAKQIEMFLNQESIKEDWYSLFVSAIDIMMMSQLQKSAIKRVLDLLCMTPFLEKHLTAFVLDKNLSHGWNGGQSFLDAMVRILENLLQLFPYQSLKIITAVPHLTNMGKVYELDEMVLKIASIETKASEIYKKMKEQPKSRFGLTSVGGNSSDFSEESVWPTCKDITENKNVFVRPVVLDGGYADKEEYLDIQFRLLKQDFVIPLREGIKEYKDSGKKKHFNSSDLRMYYGVHILGIVTHDGIDHVLQFDTSKLKSVKWDFSKRLIYGSLVCLSKDGFETMAIARISNRDPKDLKHGYVNVNVKSGLDMILNSTPMDEFVMAETVAFFESYYHVLEGLQEMRENLPLEEHIVACEKKVKPPHYLLGGISSPSYDLSPFMKDNKAMDVPVLLTTKWPSSERMCLNNSQREAAQVALTKRFAVIQGPPGTGKTYVGLKVVETILKNQSMESQDLKSGTNKPILVVCYTNHALDQFLEGILQFCHDGIIRIGGRSKSESLEKFNLKAIRQKMISAKQLECITVEKSRKECYRRLRTLMEEIADMAKKMEQIDSGACSEAKLISFDVMNEEHKNSLRFGNQDGYTHKGSVLSRWLNVKNDDPEEFVAKMIEAKMTRLILEDNFPAAQDTELSLQMPIEARATWYLKHLAILIKQLRRSIQQLEGNRGFEEVENKIQSLYHDEEICKREIVQDYMIRTVIKPKSFNMIKKFLGREQPSNQVVKTWLLGLHKEQHKQLDDIERLIAKTLALNPQTEQDMELDDLKRVVADDDDEHDIDLDYLEKSKALKNSFTSIINRIEILGIDEQDEQTSENIGDWQMVSKPLNYTKMRKKITRTKPMTTEREQSVANIWEYNMKERFALYKLWMERCKEVLSLKMQSLIGKYEETFTEKNEIIGQETVSILRGATVIGMTTTGAARYRSVLQAVGCRIIVVEEAAEVLEAHIVTALNKHCEHLILIGDHQQLRPTPVVYELARDYGLEISLFERLVKNQFPHVVLQEQHRMRPEISKIMRHIYPDLQDHAIVSTYEHIQGVAKDFFLIKHREKESNVEDTRSRANVFEASYVTKLCSYLLLQGYEPTKITILATYAGQVLAIKNSMRESKCNTSVRVTSVDNFQGEENDIIILSLVRSNEEKNIGFLKVDNRVCVALSRSKKGLFIIGNFELLSLQSKLWQRIVFSAQAEGSIGDGLPVVCRNHPDEGESLMFTAEDFDSRPLGGCGLPCHYRLSCGHLCELTCHGYDQLHQNYLCRKPCTKTCAHGHPCTKMCFEDCGKCYIKVSKTIPSCGHEDLVPCYMSPQEAICSHPCEAILDGCEHQCSGKCGKCKANMRHALCTKKVYYLWPCGHTEEVECHKNPEIYPCPHPCETILDCGHICKGSCSSCLQGKVHLACAELCSKTLPCGHQCKSNCGAPCKPCLEQCPSKCRHGGCREKCGHTCIPCKEKCKHHCKCNSCKNLCSEVCSYQTCGKRCKRTLMCQHRTCSGLCGELCVCGICSEINEITQNFEKSSVKEEKLKIPEIKSGTGNLNFLEEETPKDRSKHPSKEMSMDQTKRESSYQDSEKADAIEAQDLTSDSCSHLATCSGTLGNSVDNPATSEGEKPSPQRRKSLLRLPTCNHVFLVEELDRYVRSFEPGGSSFIPCPVCPIPIQNCARYHSVIQARARKRNKLKEILITETEVLPPEKQALKENLETFGDLSQIFKSTDPYAVKYKSEVAALSLKLKLTFILNQLDVMKPSMVDASEIDQLLLTRGNAVHRIGKYYTPQQKREFTIDLVSCLFKAVIIKAKDIDGKDTEEMSASILNLRKNQEALAQDEGVEKYLQLVEDALHSFMQMEKEKLIASSALTAALQYDVIEKHMRTIFEVLRSDDSQFLSDIVQCSTKGGARPRQKSKEASPKKTAKYRPPSQKSSENAAQMQRIRSQKSNSKPSSHHRHLVDRIGERSNLATSPRRGRAQSAGLCSPVEDKWQGHDRKRLSEWN